jgi:hypothetical protein
MGSKVHIDRKHPIIKGISYSEVIRKGHVFLGIAINGAAS